MPSPFPGMDPYIESEEVFPGFHNSFITHLQDSLNEKLPKGYIASSATRVWVDDVAPNEPDVAVSSPRSKPRPARFDPAEFVHAGLVAVVTPAPEPHEEAYLEIITPSGRRLVTHIELLSPSNKDRGKGKRLYKRKQYECQLGGVNLVEIDLLRSGVHATDADLPSARQLTGGFDYHIALSIPSAYPTVYVQPIRLEDPLPVLPIPLDAGIPPILIALRTIVDQCYGGGRYAELIDYTRPCSPPLSGKREAWARALTADGVIASNRS